MNDEDFDIGDLSEPDIDLDHNVRRYVRRILFRIEKDRLRGVAPGPRGPRPHRLLQVRGRSNRPTDHLAGLRRSGREVRLDSPRPRSGS